MHEVLKTDRLILRPLETTDASDFARLVNHWDICRMTGTFPYPFPKPSVEGLVEIFCARAFTGHSYHWAITLEGQLTGVMGIYRKEDGWDVGYWLGQPFWGQGLGGEAIEALVDHVFSRGSDTQITACVFTDNPASDRLLRRIGFQQSPKVCEGYSLARRSLQDNWTYSMSQKDFAQRSRRISQDSDVCSA